jgi:hypothetical protein
LPTGGLPKRLVTQDQSPPPSPVGVIFHPRARENGASGRATLLSGHHGLDDPDIDRLRAAIPRLAYIEGDAVAALSVTLVVLTNDRSQQRRGRRLDCTQAAKRFCSFGRMTGGAMNAGDTGSTMQRLRMASMSRFVAASMCQPATSPMGSSWPGCLAPQRADRWALIEHPAYRERQHRFAKAFVCQLLEFIDGSEMLRVALTLEFRIDLAEVIAVEFGICGHPSAQETTTERAVAQNSKARTCGVGQHVVLDFPLK